MKKLTNPPDYLDTLGPHIRRRKRLGILHCDVANVMRLHPAAVCKAEAGRVLHVSADWLAAYAAAVDPLEPVVERDQRSQAQAARRPPHPGYRDPAP